MKCSFPILAVAVLAGQISGCSRSSPAICHADAGGDEVARFRAHLTHEAARGFSGAVLIADSQGVVFHEEYGDAARDTIPTPFWIASISKPITAVATLRLVEEERLDLHAPVNAYLPDVPEHWQNLTVHHLLGHRAGFPHAYVSDSLAEREEALRAILALEPIRELGQFSYSNDGYTLLAILIELVSGESFESYVRSRVFEPAGMDHAGFWGFEPVPSPVAPSNDPGGVSGPYWGYRGPTGIYATPEDLYRFVVALQHGRILEEETVTDMLASKNPSIGPDAQTYGYGWALNLSGGHVAEYWHAGYESSLGHNGLLKVTGSRIYVILSNSGEPDFDTDVETWAHWVEQGLRACGDED